MAVDPQKLETELAKMVEGLKPFIEGKEINNVLARMQTEVVPAFQRWKAGEVNRGIEENSVLNAFVCFVSSQMVGMICECVGTPEAGDKHFELANSLMMAIGEEVGAIMTGQRKMDSYHVAAETAH